MAKPTSLDTLINLASEQRDQAAVALGRLHSTRAENESQLEALLNYRFEYRQQMKIAMYEGVDMARLSNYKLFLAALDGAIAAQRQAVSDSDARLDQGRDNWRDREQRVQSFDTLAERRRAAERRREDRIEQDINDEHAGRAHAHGKR